MALDLSRSSNTSYHGNYDLSSAVLAHLPVNLSLAEKQRPVLRERNNHTTKPTKHHARVSFALPLGDDVIEENCGSPIVGESSSQTWCVKRRLRENEAETAASRLIGNNIDFQYGVSPSKRLSPGPTQNQRSCEGVHSDGNDRLLSPEPGFEMKGQHYSRETNIHTDGLSSLPNDPRQWTKDDVRHWLEYMRAHHALRDVTPDRFAMNGKALCLMNITMFCYRVPLGGTVLFRDFQRRLNRAVGVRPR